MLADAAEHARIERQVLALQSVIALAYSVAALSGLFGVDGPVRNACVAWILGYHVVHAAYVLWFRVPGRPIFWIEAVTPLLDATCITAGVIAIGDPDSPLWALYLYLLVGHARRFRGAAYAGIAVWTIANAAASQYAIDRSIDGHLITILLLMVAMAALAHTTGSAWRRAERQARVLAETDPLTGIANRRTFYEHLETLALIEAQPFAILMLDLDDFKSLNDQFGHQRGDEVLVQVAGILRDNVRSGDLLARYGGEEFIVAMPGATVEEAHAVAERLRAAVADSTPTSVSIGCAVRAFGDAPDDVIRRADGLLLEAKKTGKNSVWIVSRAAA
jgi:diguanylate cyclase (GGDEF)-like protein